MCRLRGREDRPIYGITARGATIGAAALGAGTARELPFTGHVLGAYAVLAAVLIVTGLLVRFAARAR